MLSVLRIAALLAVLAPLGAASARDYQTQDSCDGFPKVFLKTRPGLCVGLVASHLGFARGVATIGHDVFVLDMGGWRKGQGRLLRLQQDGHAPVEVLLSGFDKPSALVAGADGALYMGVAGRIVRVDLSGAKPEMRDVVTGLPETGRHPLTALAFASDGQLYINIGSATDHCETPDDDAPDAQKACSETAQNPPRASIVSVRPGPGAVAWKDAKLVATGLRNSMGLAVLPNGTLVAAVNARDAINKADPNLSDTALPHDTYDVIRPGADYGWPYCFDNNLPSPEYPHHACADMEKPALLLPAHAAPLGLLAYQGDALPDLQGQLVVPYHGYRKTGHRIMTLKISAGGEPVGVPEPLVWGWEGRTPLSPAGAPVSVVEMADGSLLVSEDHNSTLLRIAKSDVHGETH
ncbi:glucose dehydrogenase [Gluconobacter thailandicus]|uniref:PQQ-dependent sugar dehydrogenase n=1 Tax=Gluconobacter thailandicus TaxID=257438 RepID=UPI000777AE62|nr:PQQ-dependent sugar dehydrogenase [Gluconobacter thailandicus]KXV32519.1 glucose dehydrogenase [Gluconobacter thailandicus]